MNTNALSRTITNIITGMIFWLVLLFSLLLRDQITIEAILFDVGKSLVVAGISAFLLIIVNDAFVKSMVVSAKLNKVDRFQGGLSYHVAPPTREELSWRKKYEGAHPDFRKEIGEELTTPKSKKK